MLDVPREIADLIVAEMASVQANLSPLLLVCRVFQAAARTVIFRHTTISAGATASTPQPQRGRHGAEKRYLLFLDIIRENPDVIDLVRHLSIQLGVLDEEEQKAESEFAAILRMLLQAPIKTLEIEAFKGVHSYYKLSTMDPAVMNTFIALRSTPSIRALIFRRLVNFPLELLVGPASLDPQHDGGVDQTTSLVMSNVRVVPGNALGSQRTRLEGTISETPFHPLPELTVLEISSPIAFIRAFRRQPSPDDRGYEADGPCPCFPKLTSLKVYDLDDSKNDEEVSTVTKMLNALPSLQKLSLGYGFSWDGWQHTSSVDPFVPLSRALGNAPNLQKLDLVCTEATRAIYHSLGNMTHFLLHIPTSNNIQHLSATFSWRNAHRIFINRLASDGSLALLAQQVLNRWLSLVSFRLVIYYEFKRIGPTDTADEDNLCLLEGIVVKAFGGLRTSTQFTLELEPLQR